MGSSQRILSPTKVTENSLKTFNRVTHNGSLVQKNVIRLTITYFFEKYAEIFYLGKNANDCGGMTKSLNLKTRTEKYLILINLSSPPSS